MTPLGRLIESRRAELGLSYREIGKKGGIPWSTVSLHAHSTKMTSVPQQRTLEGLAKGLDLPLAVVKDAVARGIGVEVVDHTPTTLRSAPEVIRVVAAIQKLSEADVVRLRQMAESWAREADEGDAGRSENGG